MLSAWQGNQTGGKDRSEQKTKREGSSNMVLEKAGAQPLGFHCLLLPLAAQSASSSECLGFAELISWCSLGYSPIRSSLNSGASTKQAPAPPSNVPGKSQDSGVTSSSLGTDPACLHHAGFCPCPQSLSPLIPSPQAIPGSSEGVMISLSIYIQPTAK